MYTTLSTYMQPEPVLLDLPQVLVFRTSVLNAHDVERLQPMLDDLVPQGRWNFDLEDRDHILRVETVGFVRERVIVLLNGLGFACDELE
jgi:hypothetical protein